MRHVATALLLASAAAASDLRDALDGGADPATITKILDARPARHELAEAIAPRHWPRLAALAARPEGWAVVKRLLDTAYGQAPAAPAVAIPPAQLAQNAVCGPEDEGRREALSQLARGYGARAVPYLLPYLRDADQRVQYNALSSLGRFGAVAVPPLAAAVRTRGKDVRHFAARLLADAKDPRALAVLLEVAAREPLSATAEAAAKLRALHPAWAGDGTVAGAHLALARRYFEGDPAAACWPVGQPTLVWALEGDRLVPRPVEPHLYFIELGKCAAQDAIRLDRKGKQGTELLARLEECAKLATKLVEESRR